jgi:hypothetical protein
MEKGNIKIVEIADFKNSEHVLDYVDNDFVIINSLEGSPYNEDTIRLGCFLIAICLEGCIQLDVNYKTYQLEAGDLLLGLPNTIISHAMVSPKHKIRLAAFSTQFLQRVVKMEKDTWNTVMHIHNNPIKSVGEEGDKEIFKFYRELLMAKINDEPHPYHREVMQHLFSAIFCEMLGHLNKEVNPSAMTADTKESIKQSDYILRKFIEMLSKDNGIHRSVGYYADAETVKALTELFRKSLNKDKLEVHVENLKNENVSAMMTLSEESRRMNRILSGNIIVLSGKD